MKRYTYLFILLLTLVSCTAEDYNKISSNSAPEFDGVVETQKEVDLGLKAIWCGYNVGADDPSQYGDYFAWGECVTKEVYTTETFAHHGNLEAGQVLSPDNDVASLVLGYGWVMPSASDWQELAENTIIRKVSYKGVVGYVATSTVAGYEGKSIFFPCSGYRADMNTNNVSVQALYWANSIVDNAQTRAVNAFFTEATNGCQLLLNMPPKGVGGLPWCGYPVRGIKKFTLDWNGADISVDRITTETHVDIKGNAEWSISATNGAVCTPSSGIGDCKVVVTFPENETTEIKSYAVTMTSPEFSEAKSYLITQFGVVPDFMFAQELTSVGWDTESCQVRVQASSDVSWTAAIKWEDGTLVEGASLTPSEGIGPSDINVSIPSSTDISKKTRYYIEIVTDDIRIPEELKTVNTVIEQDICPLTPFGTVWANSFLQAWSDSGFVAKETFRAETASASGSSSLSNPGKDNGYIKGQFTFSFTVAQSGTGILEFTVLQGSATHKFKVTATRSGQNVFSKEYSLGDNTARHAVDCEIPDLQKGDVIKIAYSNGTSNARLYCGKTYPISWKAKN